MAPGQERDSVIIRNDTAYIIKQPVVITKKVYVSPSKPATEKNSHFFIVPYFQTSYSLDYITVCSLQRPYYNQIKEHTNPRLNYTFGALAMLRKKRFLFNLDVGYTSYRERFAIQETTSLNRHQVLTASLDFGYSIFKNKDPFEILLTVGVGYLHTLGYEGSTLDKDDHSNIITLSEQRTYDKSSLIADGKILGAYQLDTRKTLLFGPVYSVNILSITRKRVPFGKWRHNMGFMLGVAIGL